MIDIEQLKPDVNHQEFLKEHPSLEYRLWKRNYKLFSYLYQDIHFTQIDKQKVRDLYKQFQEDLDRVPPDRASAFDSLMEELKELGL